MQNDSYFNSIAARLFKPKHHQFAHVFAQEYLWRPKS